MPTLAQLVIDLTSEDKFAEGSLEKLEERLKLYTFAQIKGLQKSVMYQFQEALPLSLWYNANQILLEKISIEIDAHEKEYAKLNAQKLITMEKHRLKVLKKKNKREAKKKKEEQMKTAANQMSKTQIEREENEYVAEFKSTFAFRKREAAEIKKKYGTLGIGIGAIAVVASQVIGGGLGQLLLWLGIIVAIPLLAYAKIKGEVKLKKMTEEEKREAIFYRNEELLFVMKMHQKQKDAEEKERKRLLKIQRKLERERRRSSRRASGASGRASGGLRNNKNNMPVLATREQMEQIRNARAAGLGGNTGQQSSRQTTSRSLFTDDEDYSVAGTDRTEILNQFFHDINDGKIELAPEPPLPHGDAPPMKTRFESENMKPSSISPDKKKKAKYMNSLENRFNGRYGENGEDSDSDSDTDTDDEINDVVKIRPKYKFKKQKTHSLEGNFLRYLSFAKDPNEKVRIQNFLSEALVEEVEDDISDNEIENIVEGIKNEEKKEETKADVPKTGFLANMLAFIAENDSIEEKKKKLHLLTEEEDAEWDLDIYIDEFVNEDWDQKEMEKLFSNYM